MDQKQNKFHYKVYHNKDNLKEILEEIDEVEELIQVNPTIELDDHPASFRTGIHVKSDDFDSLNEKLEEEFTDYWFDY